MNPRCPEASSTREWTDADRRLLRDMGLLKPADDPSTLSQDQQSALMQQLQDERIRLEAHTQRMTALRMAFLKAHLNGVPFQLEGAKVTLLAPVEESFVEELRGAINGCGIPLIIAEA
ncbi:hypothetical protein IPJ72_06330 [Candidatus Peregrinibacteria bacterium]|nr:MAG: hypothetical protein IPJ72_06330 [Candidatus Peregrinibacteria bacterium]